MKTNPQNKTTRVVNNNKASKTLLTKIFIKKWTRLIAAWFNIKKLKEAQFFEHRTLFASYNTYTSTNENEMNRPVGTIVNFRNLNTLLK